MFPVIMPGHMFTSDAALQHLLLHKIKNQENCDLGGSADSVIRVKNAQHLIVNGSVDSNSLK